MAGRSREAIPAMSNGPSVGPRVQQEGCGGVTTKGRPRWSLGWAHNLRGVFTGAGLVLSGEEEEKGQLTAVCSRLKDNFAHNGAKFFPAMADMIVRADGHIYNLGEAGWALGRHLLWEGGAALDRAPSL